MSVFFRYFMEVLNVYYGGFLLRLCIYMGICVDILDMCSSLFFEWGYLIY